MWRLTALLVVILVGVPLTMLPVKTVAIIAGAAAALCALGIVVRSTPVLTGGVAIALGEYAIVFALSDGPPRLEVAVLAGIVVLLLIEGGDFDRRFRDIVIGPGVVASQLGYWLGLAALSAVAALVLIIGASAVSSVMSLPWAPLLAAVGALVALAAGAVTLRRAGGSGE